MFLLFGKRNIHHFSKAIYILFLNVGYCFTEPGFQGNKEDWINGRVLLCAYFLKSLWFILEMDFSAFFLYSSCCFFFSSFHPSLSSAFSPLPPHVPFPYLLCSFFPPSSKAGVLTTVEPSGKFYQELTDSNKRNYFLIWNLFWNAQLKIIASHGG